MTEQQDYFQERGEKAREALGIDGTAADAQNVQHPFTPDPMNMAFCAACETGLFHTVHEE